MGELIEVKGWGGTVRFDGQMVTIVRKGFLARASVGKGEKQIPLAHITAVQFKPAGPLINGLIQFTVAGGNERRSAFGSQTRDAARDENSVVFIYSQRGEFERLRDTVQSALAAHHAVGLASGAAPASIPEQIRQLAELRESGILTDLEFEAKKADLLERM